MPEGTNRNGEMLCEFVFANNKMSTQFQHKKIHKATWIPLSQNTINQIDHVFINANSVVVIPNTRSIIGPNMDSDYLLQSMIIKNY